MVQVQAELSHKQLPLVTGQIASNPLGFGSLIVTHIEIGY